jgi:hypothetical protein
MFTRFGGVTDVQVKGKIARGQHMASAKTNIETKLADLSRRERQLRRQEITTEIVELAAEVVLAFCGGEQPADVADCLPEIIDGPGCPGAEVCFELGEGHFDGVQVGTVGGQEEHPSPERV